MNIYKKIKIGYVLGALISLVLGVFIYIVFRKGTYLHIVLPETIDLKLEYIRDITEKNSIVCFLKYYFVDFLWGVSLSFSLFSAVDFRIQSRIIIMSLISLIWGVLFELAQFFSFTQGTFDFIDISMYILAAVFAALINKTIIKRMD